MAYETPPPDPSTPPPWADRLLEWFVAPHLLEDLQGDLQEVFQKRVQQVGLARARREYAWAVLHYLTPFFYRQKSSDYPTPALTDMLRNYVKIAWRNMLKHKTFSILNVFGLALSMSVGLLILLLYQDGYNYDKFHKDADLLYRVNTVANRKNGDIEPYATSPNPIGNVIESKFAWVDNVATLKVVDDVIIKDNQRFDFRGKATTKNFLEIFNFNLQRGSPANALQEPNSIVLTADLSKKLFGDENPVNKTVQIGNRGHYKITGILKPNPGKTHFEFDALLSATLLENTTESWANYYSTYTYIKVKPNTNIEQAVSAINNEILPRYKNLPISTRDASYRFDLQALPDITPGYSIANAMGKGLPSHLLWFLALMGFIVISSALFNYTNLTLAKSFSRAKEIGVRKVMGANRTQVLSQIVSEGIVLSLIALLFAVGFVMYFKNELSELQSFQFFDLNVSITPSSFIYFLVFALSMGAIAGFLPAITISKLNPLAAIHKIENLNLFKRIGLVRTLLVLQFAFTMLFMMIITTVHKQIDFAIAMDYGFSAEQVYNIQLQGVSASMAKSKFATIAGVERISSVNKPIGTYSDSPIAIKIKKADNYESVSSYSVDNDFIPNLDLTLVAGKNFSSIPSVNETNKEVIVNELFTKKYHLGNASESIGKLIYLNDSTTATIKGVVKDFLFKPADDALEPLLLRNNPAEWNLLNVKILPHSTEKTIASLQSAWKDIAPGYEFRGEFYETTIQNNFAISKDVNKVITFFTLLSVLIGMMGLLGMAIYSVEKRQKEISLRKVLGATEGDIIITLSKGFLILLLISFGLSIPLGIYISGQILNNFANRISLGLNIILPGFTLLSLLAISTIFSQSIKAALTNPVKSLRSE
ncbi:Macrolide export ATP-binding/permease protein macB [Fibrisoma limi BUZ 3]|uniref:Macrolide export ATP-binding/permease protein macB n=1 Tax=Fibrisoma limi BUZ 3 TaxID=1185876 RepID=I2GET3_9BACT|nr:ABC transporter permease [Fibrisoma limi]CCH52408.1 Macrolide export ATP-binding/permease protein macB [Fibrisoma limi BUZ 3]